ncbi:hypothetical protein KUCAC02_003396, partial [Chaenocephalus aceratus]
KQSTGKMVFPPSRGILLHLLLGLGAADRLPVTAAIHPPNTYTPDKDQGREEGTERRLEVEEVFTGYLIEMEKNNTQLQHTS